jgi:hypothetical protein
VGKSAEGREVPIIGRNTSLNAGKMLSRLHKAQGTRLAARPDAIRSS